MALAAVPDPPPKALPVPRILIRFGCRSRARHGIATTTATTTSAAASSTAAAGATAATAVEASAAEALRNGVPGGGLAAGPLPEETRLALLRAEAGEGPGHAPLGSRVTL